MRILPRSYWGRGVLLAGLALFAWAVFIEIFWIPANRKKALHEGANSQEMLVKCKTLKTGMTEKEVVAIMGEPDEAGNIEIGPQKGKKLLVYNNPRLMDDNNKIYFDTKTLQADLIYCSNERIE
jgi:hypothetical protein